MGTVSTFDRRHTDDRRRPTDRRKSEPADIDEDDYSRAMRADIIRLEQRAMDLRATVTRYLAERWLNRRKLRDDERT